MEVTEWIKICSLYQMMVARPGHSRKLFKRRCRLDIKKFAFSNRIVDTVTETVFQITVLVALR